MFDERYVRGAFFFKTIEGFLEASPMLILQLSLWFRQDWPRPSWRPWISTGQENNEISAVPVGQNGQEDDFEIFGRIYNEGTSDTRLNF